MVLQENETSLKSNRSQFLFTQKNMAIKLEHLKCIAYVMNLMQGRNHSRWSRR
jgi:hypothetical protein